jgi:DNA modification methylase
MRVIEGDCLEVLKTLPDASIDAVVTDPPYPCIKRDYGVWTEEQWWELMMGVCAEVRRVLKPTGSAVFVLQPNSEKVGRMRGWLWRFMAWVCDEWNMVQDAWWWNYAGIPTAIATQGGLMRTSVKACVWAGIAKCYRDQGSVLWSESDSNRAYRLSQRCDNHTGPGAGGRVQKRERIAAASAARGGVTPFNLLPFTNADSTSSAGAWGHGAGTPLPLSRWWTRYICPPGGVVLDPFAGSGTMGVAALREGRDAVLIERKPEYVEIIHRRLAAERAETPLFGQPEVK